MTSENVASLAAPVSRHFVSIEGEGPRLGQITGFIEFGNAPPMDLACIVKLPACQTTNLVFDVCGLHTSKTVEDALEAVDALVALLPQRFLVLEAREEQLHTVWSWLKDTRTALSELYVTLASEPTGAPWVDLALWRNEEGDEALPVVCKRVVPYPSAPTPALLVALERYGNVRDAGLLDVNVYVYPRIDWSSAPQRQWLRAFYEAAVSNPSLLVDGRVRLAVLEHEAVGVL